MNNHLRFSGKNEKMNIEIDSNTMLMLEDFSGILELTISSQSEVITILKGTCDVTFNIEVNNDSRFLCYLIQGKKTLDIKAKVSENKKFIQKNLVITDENTQISITNNAIHEKENGYSELLTKGVVKKGSLILQSTGTIKPSAKNSESHVKQKLLVLEKADIKAMPFIEVETNEAIATHSLGIREISKEEIYYGESRGIEENKMKYMLTLGFIQELIEPLPIEEKRIVLNALSF